MIPVVVSETRRQVPENRAVSRAGTVCAPVTGAASSTTASATAPRLLTSVITFSFTTLLYHDRRSRYLPAMREFAPFRHLHFLTARISTYEIMALGNRATIRPSATV